MTNEDEFPELPIEEWEETKNTLHLYLQIIGKIRLKTFPKMNHWWHVPFYLSPRGITTRPIPYNNIQFEMSFDFIDYLFVITSSSGHVKRFPIQDGLSVSEFHNRVFEDLHELCIYPKILAVPYDMPAVSKEPFKTDTAHKSYDKEYVNRFWRILFQVDSLFQEFRGKFIGKCTPPHLFWHHFDLALTLFSGRKAPEREGSNIVEREAYSHEVISFGFWAGDMNVREPAFYAYAAPVPERLFDQPIKPEKALWNKDAGMAIYMYNEMRKEADPKLALKDFFQSVYNAAARLAEWDIEGFKLPE